jgi:hypothetical protein
VSRTLRVLPDRIACRPPYCDARSPDELRARASL